LDPFELVDARSAAEAVSLLEKYGSRAQFFASGADVLYMLKDRIRGPAVTPPEVLVNLRTAKELDGIEISEGRLRVGAMATLADLAGHPAVRRDFPLIAEAVERIASPQLRNTSTVAGNLCQRPRCWYFRNPDIVCLKKGGSSCWAVEGENRWYHAIVEGGPCHIVHPSDLAPALVSLGASATLLGPRGKREVLLEQFFVTTEKSLFRENVLEAGELIVGVIVPRPRPGTGQAFEKATIRQADEFALVSVAVAATLDGEKCLDCRITYGGVSPRPYRARLAEAELRGKVPSDEAVTEAAGDEFRAARPMSGNAYKIPLAGGVLRRAFRRIREARSRAAG
jgi:xanthine dehydrogenase YagS FAD-binding subunit